MFSIKMIGKAVAIFLNLDFFDFLYCAILESFSNLSFDRESR